MAKNVTGPGGGFTGPAGFNARYESWEATLDFGAVDVTGFDDNGYNYTEATSCKLTGSASGTMQYGDATTSPIPSAALSSTFAPASLAGSITLTVATGCTLTFTGVVVSSSLSRSAKSGTKGDVTHNFENQGAITETWDESS